MLKRWLYAEPYKYSVLRGQRFLFTCIFLICKLPIPESSRMEQQKLFFEFIASWHEKLHRIKITPFKKKKTLIPGINSFPLELKDFCKIDSMTVDRFFFLSKSLFFFFKRKTFLFLVRSQGTHLSAFSTFPICFKCLMTTAWSTSSAATSRVILRASVLMMALN